MAPSQPQPRRKGGGTRTWLVVSVYGRSHLEEVGKHLIMRRAGLPARDLRILDPVLSYPSTILGREKAIVVNLEHIKAIITATEVLVMNSQNPSVAPFVRDLECRVSIVDGTKPPASDGCDADMEVAQNGKDESPSSLDLSQSPEELRNFSEKPDVFLKRNISSLKAMQNVPKLGGPMALPFEFRALEVCLESTCRCLESETSTLEQEAYPALDDLSSKISTLNLQRVRQIKNRLVALSGRVQKVRDELENLLDDDMDMAEMYLTDKLVRQQFEDAASKYEANNDAFESDDERDEDLESNKSSTGNMTNFKPKIEELEMLLEAYFAQIEGTLNKLSTLREYVDDTEDYINIILDDKQNQLLQMGVLLSTATLLLNAGIVVVGLFGMNIHITLFDGKPRQFWETTFGTVGGCVTLYFIAVHWGKRRGLLGL